MSPLKSLGCIGLLLILCGCAPSNSARAPVPVAHEEAQKSRAPWLRIGDTELRHELSSDSLVFSPDSSALYSGGTDGTIREWEVGTGKLRATFEGHIGPVTSLSLAIRGDYLASAGHDGAIRVWDTSSGQVVRRISAHSGGVGSVSIAPDGKSVVSTGFKDDAVRFWDVSSGRELDAIQTVGPVTVRHSPDGKWIATGGPREKTRLWRAGNATEAKAIAETNSLVITFSASGHILVDGTLGIRTLDLATGQDRGARMVHNGLVQSASLAPNGTRFVTGSYLGANVYDVETGKELFALKGHYGAVTAVRYAPNGEVIATGGGDSTIRLYHAKTGALLRAANAHQSRVSALRISNDDTVLFSAGWDGTIRLWELPSGRQLRVISCATDKSRAEQGSFLNALLLTADGRRVISNALDGSVHVWNVSSGERLNSIQRGQTNGALALFGEDKSLLVGGLDGALESWSLENHKRSLAFEQQGGVRHLAVSPTEPFFAIHAGNAPPTVALRSTTTGEVLRRLVYASDDAQAPDLTGEPLFEFLPDGKTLVFALRDCEAKSGSSLRLFETATGSQLRTYSATGSITALGSSRDGKRIAAGVGNMIGVWDVASGERLEWFRSDHWVVRSLVFNQKGTNLFSGGDDGTISGWKVR